MSKARQAVAQELGAAVQAYQRCTDAFDDVVAAHLDLNRTDLRCLDWLSEGPRTIGSLAAATGLSSAATTTLVDRLERKGFVQRVRDTGDRRRILVELTGQAIERSAELYGPLVTEGNRMIERYSEAELALVRDYLRASIELTDRHRRRIAALPPVVA
ncbi:MAG TPA: MarR family transcriptional regulator [Candidatus Limnocylindrales bacterium]|nr:MarR family transcriptional regulator [Candidatus Limnocylindrales bacterium]